MRRKKRWQVFVAAGFCILYLAIMLACTFLVRGQYLNEFENNFQTTRDFLVELIEQMEKSEERTEEEREASYQYIVSSALLHSRYQQYAAILYDRECGFAARSGYAAAVKLYRDYRIGAEKVFSLPDYFTEEEIEQLAHYALERTEEIRAQRPEPYRFLGRISQENGDLSGFFVQKVFWKQGIRIDEGEQDPFSGAKSERSHSDDKNNTETWVQAGSEVIWEWTSPDPAEEDTDIVELSLVFPGLMHGYGSWKHWKDSDYLQHSVPEDLSSYYASFSEKVRMSPETFQAHFKEDYTVSAGNRTCDLTLITECRPWAAAMDYMKFVYLAGFFLMMACMGTVIMVIRKNEEQRARLEENQRDFINAMAHEMKTPLGIIRGSAENLQENTVAEKKDYYLQQIIGQTEEMDGMVADIIGAARLESQHLVLRKERVSVNDILREQLRKFEPLMEQKGISVQFSAQQVFELEGDYKYLEKAFASLTDNAVSYCDENGSIKITMEADGCQIENTCTSVREEDVQHAFEIFYQGHHAASAEKHLGIGLYLTRKILSLHNVQITVEKMPEGFGATCKKGGKKKR